MCASPAERITIDVQIDDRFAESVSPHLLEEAARVALRMEGRNAAEVSIVITDDEGIRELNRTFAQMDAPTDVLSFSAQEGPETFVVGDAQAAEYLGDIVISLPYARRQAEAQGQPLEAELRLLTVHGILHLLGYDHAEAEEEAEMWRRQETILARLRNDG